MCSVGREGARAIREDDGNGRRRVKGELMSFYKRRADDVALSASVDENSRRVTINIADKGEEGSFGLFDGECGHTNAPFSQSTDFALG